MSQSTSFGWPWLLGLFLTAPLGLWGQERDSIQAVEMGTILIYEPLPDVGFGGVSYKTDSADLQEFILHDLADLMSTQPSVHVKGYGASGSSTPAFRGTGAGHTQVLWNDLPLNSVSLGLSDFSLGALSIVDDVRTVYGLPSLGQIGGGLGGALLMQTRPAYFGDLDFNYGHLALQEIGSFGSRRSAYRGIYGNEVVQGITRLSFGRARNDFPFADITQPGNPEVRQTNAGLRHFNALQEVHLGNTGRAYLSAGTWIYDLERELPPTLLTTTTGEMQHDRGVRSYLRYTRTMGRFFELSATGAWFREHLDYEHPVANIFSAARTDRLIGYVEWRRHRIDRYARIRGLNFSGVNLRVNHDRARNDGYPAGRQMTLASAATGMSFVARKYLRATLTLRQELSDQGWSPLLGFLGMQVQWKKFTLKANGGRNYRLPTLNDLYWEPGGNPELLPEQNWSGEAQLDYQIGRYGDPQRLNLSLGGYLNRVDNWILWVPGNRAFWSPENVQRVGVRGLESAVEWNAFGPNARKRTWKLQARLAYSYTRSTVTATPDPNDASRGKQLIYTPEHTAQATVRLRYRRWHLRYLHEWVGPRFTTRDNGEQVAGYTLGNVHAGRSLGGKRQNLTLQAGLRNLWDVDYQNIAWRPMPGRSFFVRLQWEFAQN
ncbi:MAG: TonB-dependent receptor plug domain-containing protein [Bacteroidota bacterium]